MALVVVVAEHAQITHHRDAWGVDRNQNLALLLMGGGLRIGLAHHDHDLAVLVEDVRRPPLASVEHVVIAVAFDAQ